MHKLIVVGSGIKSISHLTEETKRVIQNADKVLYLVNEDNLKQWIQREAKNSESLDSIYFSSEKRIEAYQSLTNYIIEQYKKVSILCVVFYGHPTFFADSALNAVRQIKKNGGEAIILPAVSAQDCLFSDLEIDPGDQGCFSIEATELVLFERCIDVRAHLILWQVSNFGRTDGKKTNNLSILKDYLIDYYPEDYSICLYEAPSLPTCSPRIEWIQLGHMDQFDISLITTAYIPPIENKPISNKYLRLLNLTVDDLILK
ncbi:TPA: methylase [Legionella pneumophila]|uniref:Tetrapyrrole methylase n=1 Tax=Legionella jamestowniensis TaxID=455 RepID=A0A0W0UKV3_9GAMM|nr:MULTISPECIES: SAM-dependent methyltransferase [Legionella]HAT8850029.1 methylase [Legionella pneumophila subsp. pneumophila]KTD08399.1 tetrapyrrole methylase [Legionella jamestowniensis]CZI71407.1 Tetrapyrrole (Corrin/Porphyrin) Methylases [Legionella pneumophila]CZI71623.1 Tetrapyrrole (Corrin/Porphyrin) Methylases [Legionella pneumophila]CZP34991.1 Tetrapyrrole (Corrin/Porphyrin) Methylases [Legionella pneumophila]